MNLKTLALVVGALGVAAGSAYFLNRPSAPPPADPRLGQNLLPSEKAEKAEGLRLQQGGQTVELRRTAEGTWVVPSYHDLPADFSRLSQLTENLANAKWQTLVTRNPERIKRLSLGDLQVDLLDGTGQSLWSLQVGKEFEGGGRFVRNGDEPLAFVANLNLWVDTDPKAWADSSLLKVKPEEVQQLTVHFADAPALVFRREKADAPFVLQGDAIGRSAKASQITSALNALTGLRFSQTEARDETKVVAARAHGRPFILKTFGGREWTVTLQQAPLPPAMDTPATEGPTPTPTPAPVNPVYAEIVDSEPNSPLNGAMSRRAFEVYSFVLSSLPPGRDAWLEAPPPPSPTPTPPPSP